MSDNFKIYRNAAIGGILFAAVSNMIRSIFVDNQFERIANGIDLIAGTVVVCGLVWLYLLKYQYPDFFRKKDKTIKSHPPSSVPEPKPVTASPAEKAANAELWRNKQ